MAGIEGACGRESGKHANEQGVRVCLLGGIMRKCQQLFPLGRGVEAGRVGRPSLPLMLKYLTQALASPLPHSPSISLTVFETNLQYIISPVNRKQSSQGCIFSSPFL